MSDINPTKKHVHKCSVCKENFFWNDEACWYGQWEDQKGRERCLEKCCSHHCFNKSKYRKKDPEFTNERKFNDRRF